MNFFKNLHPLLRVTKNDNSNSTAGYALLQAIGDSLTTAESYGIQSKIESFLNTADGSYLDEFGSWFGVYRKDGQSDDDYRQWIHDFVLLKRGTVNSIVHALKTILDLPNANISVYEPYKNMFTLDKSFLDGADHLEGHYYRYAIITVNIDQAPSQEISDIIQAFKPAGVMFWINSKLDGGSYYKDTYKLRLDTLTDSIISTYMGSNFNIDQIIDSSYAYKNIINSNIFKLDSSYLDGPDVLGGDINKDRTMYSSGVITENTLSGIENNFDSNYLDQLNYWSSLGTNLLTGSQGPFTPDSSPSNYDNAIYTSVNGYFENGVTYTISSKSNGNFTDDHEPNTESDNIVLWLTNVNLDNSESKFSYIVSSSTTGTTGTTFAWPYPSQYATVRVNSYHKEPDMEVDHIKIEKGSVATPWCPNPEEFSYVSYDLTNEDLISLSPSSESYFNPGDIQSNDLNFDGKDNSAVGTNLLTGTADKILTGSGSWVSGYLSNETENDFLPLLQGLEGETVTFSFDYEYHGFVKGSGQNRIGWEVGILADSITSYHGRWYNPDSSTNSSGSGRISGTFVVPKNITSIVAVKGWIEFSGSGTGTLSHFKLEKGSVATDWCPNPADVLKNLTVSIAFKDIFYNRFGSFIRLYTKDNPTLTYDSAWKSIISNVEVTLNANISPSLPIMLYNFNTSTFDSLTAGSKISNFQDYVSTSGYSLLSCSDPENSLINTIFNNIYLYLQGTFDKYNDTTAYINSESEEILIPLATTTTTTIAP